LKSVNCEYSKIIFAETEADLFFCLQPGETKSLKKSMFKFSSKWRWFLPRCLNVQVRKCSDPRMHI